MLIVPEIQKVFILVPRTGSGTLYRQIGAKYPKAMLLYRHMEADGCPHGYDRWERIGFVRHPLFRLWSLYNFMRNFGGGAQVQGGAASSDAQRVRAQVAMPFEEWLLNNREPWTVPFDLNGNGAYWPVLARMNSAPETRLSQWAYLRPDLGVTVHKFEELKACLSAWGLDPAAVSNATVREGPPTSEAISNHLSRFCKWDLEQDCELL